MDPCKTVGARTLYMCTVYVHIIITVFTCSAFTYTYVHVKTAIFSVESQNKCLYFSVVLSTYTRTCSTYVSRVDTTCIVPVIYKASIHCFSFVCTHVRTL